ncbi:dihydropteroate synthase [Chitinophaga sedimenti]|uniref:dihydropteroate synthase n=1 Tax=Chitinophaga sedimenti TaxID=2033606 RepID=UPI0020065513|nr:dihydropteroate synthase [Chitinophaga sedimenti]MCK7555142.1 dihydropteroate synthase [Chitinophaga sedimenti]
MKHAINCRGKLLDLSTPVVMGIMNINEDSFFAGSRSHGLHEVNERAGKLLAEGAAILDLGGQSTRPGAVQVSEEEEASRVIPAIHAIIHHHPEAIISVDTYFASVAEKAVLAGASIVNDISAGELDKQMIPTVARLNVPYVAMHMKGHPETMQKEARYHDVVQEVLDYFIRKMETLRQAGIKDMIIDPGFGFAKNMEHNYQLLNGLHAPEMLGAPILAGVSRKGMIYKLLNTTAEEALNGTTVLHTLALQQGAAILRAHDVKPAAEVIRIMQYAGAHRSRD